MEGSLVAYKVFTNGSVLNASEVNDNLMNQSVITFSNSTARDAAITSPVEGMLTYLEDSDIYESYNGSAWVQALPIGAWQSYTPTFSNFTLGNGTINVAKYSQIGKTVHLKLGVTLGSTSSVAGQAAISLPVSATTEALGTLGPQGDCTLIAGGVLGIGTVQVISSTLCRMFPLVASGTYLTYAGLSATAPGTWTTGNHFAFTFTYEAA
jgi:hypothetical protein